MNEIILVEEGGRGILEKTAGGEWGGLKGYPIHNKLHLTDIRARGIHIKYPLKKLTLL